MGSLSREKILDRIKKLLSLGTEGRGATEPEIMAAVTRAKMMMAEHAISMAEVEAATAAAGGPSIADRMADRMRVHVSYTRKGSLARYDYNVAAAVNVITNTKTLRGIGDGYTQLKFVGDVEDVAVADALFFILLELTRRSARETYGRGWSESHTSYCLGFSTRLHQRAVAAVPPPPPTSMALVLKTKDDVLEDFYKSKVTKWIEQPAPKIRDADAWLRGHHDGRKVSLDSKGLAAGTTVIRTRNRGE